MKEESLWKHLASHYLQRKTEGNKTNQWMLISISSNGEAICPINRTHSVCIMLHLCMFSGLSNWYCVTNYSAIFWGRLFLTYEIIANFKRANDFDRENRRFKE